MVSKGKGELALTRRIRVSQVTLGLLYFGYLGIHFTVVYGVMARTDRDFAEKAEKYNYGLRSLRESGFVLNMSLRNRRIPQTSAFMRLLLELL